MEEFYKALDDVIKTITSSNEYQQCISLKEQMKDNEDINNIVKEIKDIQKKYVKSNYDSSIKKELDLLENQLENIPIYKIYSQYLERVNEKIEYVKEELNSFFEILLNNN